MLALLPPTSWDGLFYHLTGPKIYIEQGAIASGIDIPHLNFPSLFEMLFLLALTLRSGVTAVLLHFIFALLLMGLAFLMARDLLRVRNPWSAVLFLIAIPMVLSLAGWAYNDLALAFYQVAALYALMKWRAGSEHDKGNEHPIIETSSNQDQPVAQNGYPQWLILSGISLGLAMGLKYTSVVALFTLAGLLVWWYRRDIKRLLRPLALLLGLALLIASPWFLKNLLYTGNPVYPFVFGGDNWDEFRSAAYSEGGTGIAFNPESCTDYSQEFLIGQHPTGCEVDIGYLLQRVILLPLDITLGFRDASLDGPVGPLFLIFLPLLFIYGVIIRKHKRPAALGALLFFALAQIVFWALGAMASAALFQSRLLLPALVALCPALSWLLEDLAHLDHPRFSLQRLIYLVIGSVLLVGLLIQIINWLPHQPWGYLLGSESEQENLRRRLGAHYVAMESINSETPQDAVITFLWEPRSYYCQRDCRPDSILDTFGHLQYRFGDANGMAQQLHDVGVGYVLLHEKGLEFVLEANSPTDEPLLEPEVLLDLRNDYLEQIASINEGWYTLYRVKAPEQ
jgi:4-amino-4-deoxy-L-arabinose transferase-like glycosyltransferase